MSDPAHSAEVREASPAGPHRGPGEPAPPADRLPGPGPGPGPGRLPGPERLPGAERRRRRREFALGLGIALAILAVAFLEQRLQGIARAFPVGDSVLFLFLNAVSLILIVILVFLISRNVVKLVIERRSGILGAHLNAKFVTAFAFVAGLPTAMLFGFAVLLLNASVERWFSLKVDQALERSREVADTYYETSAASALHYGRRIASHITAERLLREEERPRLAERVQALQRDYNLGVVEVFSATGEELVTAINPEIPAATFSRADSDLVRSALSGAAASRVDEAGTGDVIRGAVPIPSTFRPDETVGAIVVNVFVPTSLTRKVTEIRAALDEYRALQPSEAHVRAAYLLPLLLGFLVILLFAVWLGIRMAKGVTGPIGALADGTSEVARGNLDVVVRTESDDEIGLLVQSFNRMTRDLREARGGLERSNTELDQRRRYMEVVLRNVGAGVVSLDADGRIGTINPSAQRLLGIPPGTALTGRKLEEVLGRPEHLEVVRDLAGQLRPKLRESLRRQVQVPWGDEVLTLLVTMTLLQDEDGGDLGLVIVYDDYTQLVKAQRMEAWREVARRIAHEIKNPLTPILLSAQRLRRRFRGRVAAAPEDALVFDECVDAITAQVSSLKLLVDEFSNFARLPQANPKPDDLNRLVREIVTSYEGTEDVRLETVLDPALPEVELDKEQMRRVLTNLVDNAIAAVREARERGLYDARDAEGAREARERGLYAPADTEVAREARERGLYAPADTEVAREARERRLDDAAEAGPARAGRVEVRTAYDAALSMARFEVADDGTGIRPEDRRRIFEPYFSTKKQGTGLGLAIVSRIVADHRGYIRVHDELPRGTRFIVELPVRA